VFANTPNNLSVGEADTGGVAAGIAGEEGVMMSQTITLKVSDHVAEVAANVAARNRQRLEDVLADWLEQSFKHVPVEWLSDDDVIALTELQLSDEQQHALSELLEKNREGALSATERERLDELMRVYEQGLLRKAQALRVAVQRGLREPLES
jgi:hypothetical protein